MSTHTGHPGLDWLLNMTDEQRSAFRAKFRRRLIRAEGEPLFASVPLETVPMAEPFDWGDWGDGVEEVTVTTTWVPPTQEDMAVAWLALLGIGALLAVGVALVCGLRARSRQ